MKCLLCHTKMKCYDDVNTTSIRIDWVKCPECESRAELEYDRTTNRVVKVIWNVGNRELFMIKKKFKLYRTWFIQSSIMFMVALITYIYFRFFYDKNTWLIGPSFVFTLVTIGWTLSALTGTITEYKKIKKETDKS